MQGNMESKEVQEALAMLYDFLREEYEPYFEKLKKHGNQLKFSEYIESGERLNKISAIFNLIPLMMKNPVDLEAIHASLTKKCLIEKEALQAYRTELEGYSENVNFLRALEAFYSICIELPELQQSVIAEHIANLEQFIDHLNPIVDALDNKLQEVNQKLTKIRHEEETVLTEQEQEAVLKSTMPDASSLPEKAVVLYLFSYPGQRAVNHQIFGQSSGGHIAIGVRNGNEWEYLSVAADRSQIAEHSLLDSVKESLSPTARYPKFGDRPGVLIAYKTDQQGLNTGRYEQCETMVLDCTEPISLDTHAMLASIRAVREEYESKGKAIPYNFYRKNCASYVVNVLKSGKVDERLKEFGLAMPKALDVYAPISIYNFFKKEFSRASSRANLEHKLTHGENLSPLVRWQEIFAKASSDLAQLTSSVSGRHYNYSQFKDLEKEDLQKRYKRCLQVLGLTIQKDVPITPDDIILPIRLTVLIFTKELAAFNNTGKETLNAFMAKIEYRLVAIMEDLNNLYSKLKISNAQEDEKIKQAFAILKSLQNPFAHIASGFLQNEYASLMLFRLQGIFAQEIIHQNCDGCLSALVESNSSNASHQASSKDQDGAQEKLDVRGKGKQLEDDGDSDSKNGSITSEDHAAYLSSFWKGRQVSSLEVLFRSAGLHRPFARAEEASLMDKREYEANAINTMGEFAPLISASKQCTNAHRALIKIYTSLSEDEQTPAFNQIRTIFGLLITLNKSVDASASLDSSAEVVLFRHFLQIKHTLAKIQKYRCKKENLLSETFYQNIINELEQISGKINQKLYLEQALAAPGNDRLNLISQMQRILFPAGFNESNIADYSSLRHRIITSLTSHDPSVYTHVPSDNEGKIIIPEKTPFILKFWRWNERFEIQELTVKNEIEKIIKNAELGFADRVTQITRLIDSNAPGSFARIFRKAAYQRYQEMAKQAVLICAFDEFVHNGADVVKLYHFLKLQVERMPQYKQELNEFAERLKDAHVKVVSQYELFQKHHEAKLKKEAGGIDPSVPEKTAIPPSLAKTLSGLKPLPIQGAFFSKLVGDTRRKIALNKQIAQVKNHAKEVLESEAPNEEEFELQVRTLVEDEFALQRDSILSR